MKSFIVHRSPIGKLRLSFLVHGSWFIAFILFSFLFSLFSPVHAQIGLSKDPTKQPGGIKITDASKAEGVFGFVFNNALAILFTIGGLGFIIMFIWGAVEWILSGGDKEKIAGARKRIVTAIIGLVLLALTFVIVIVVGQILGLQDLRQFRFTIPQLVPK